MRVSPAVVDGCERCELSASTVLISGMAGAATRATYYTLRAKQPLTAKSSRKHGILQVGGFGQGEHARHWLDASERGGATCRSVGQQSPGMPCLRLLCYAWDLWPGEERERRDEWREALFRRELAYRYSAQCVLVLVASLERKKLYS